MFGLRQWLRRRRAARIAIDPEEWADIESSLPFLARLDRDERQRLRHMALEFLAEKQMSAAPGLELQARMQLSIALQACLPILNLGLDWYGDWIGIVLYPGDFIIPRIETDESGVVHEFDDTVLGEAWEHGPVLLSWFDDPAEHEGINIVIHEFAHKLDLKNGIADGLPPLHTDMTRHAWQSAFQAAYSDFCQRIEHNEATPLDPYAADAPAEFFAVMSEAFFTAPLLLHDEYPEVYQQLRQFYRQHPLATTPTTTPDAATS
jgi:Mlc titration factor MtfA (ptsG expression regulator)